MKAKVREYYLYYNDKENNEYVVYSTETKKVTRMSYIKWFKLYRKFKLLKGYEMTEEGLLKYANDFEKWRQEIKSHAIKLGPKKCKTFDPAYYNSLNEMAKGLFIILGKGKYEHHERLVSLKNNMKRIVITQV